MNLTRSCLLAPLFLLPAAQAAPDPQVIGFPSAVVETHRLTGSTEVVLPPAPVHGFAGEAQLRITIDPTGKVIDARDGGTNRRFSDPGPAIAAARQWTFRPFEYRGRAVTVVTDMGVHYRLAPAWADPQTGFPAIDYDTLRIELTRGGCFGACPVYKVTIAGDGTVTYTSRVTEDGAGAVHQMFNANGVLLGGERRARIDRAALDGLIEKFRAAHFFGLKPAYEASITDSPTYTLRFVTGGHAMEVEDYVGLIVDMPAEVKALEEEVDRVAGADRWVNGDASTVPSLLAEGLDLRSPDAIALAWAAHRPGSERVVLDLIAAGLPLDGMARRRNDPGPRPLGVALLADALRFDRPRLALALIERGWLAKLPVAERAALFAETGGGCDPAVARAMIAAGVNPNARAPKRQDVGSSGGGTALHAARAPYSACNGVEARAPLVRALIGLGVDPNLPDADGETPIYGIEDPELLALFLASGARVDVKDKAGNSPVFGSWSDVIVLTLLDAGADPNGKYYDGKSLRALMKEREMPATAAWLATHGIR